MHIGTAVQKQMLCLFLVHCHGDLRFFASGPAGGFVCWDSIGAPPRKKPARALLTIHGPALQDSGGGRVG